MSESKEAVSMSEIGLNKAVSESSLKLETSNNQKSAMPEDEGKSIKFELRIIVCKRTIVRVFNIITSPFLQNIKLNPFVGCILYFIHTDFIESWTEKEGSGE
jgi:hypothetical protein